MHRNFIEYLAVAFENHFSVEISPDVIFYTILCEIAEEIKAHPEIYKSIFASSMQGDKKTAIVTLTV